MTEIEALLASLKISGHRLDVSGDNVLLHPAPGNRPPPEVLAELRRNKAALRQALTAVYLDFETHSVLDLELVGARTYAEHESTTILCLCYAIGDGPIQVLTDPYGDDGDDEDDDNRGGMPDDLHAAIAAGYRVVAHNYQFEHAVWHCQLTPAGWPEIPIEQWDCTAFRARLARLPAELGECAKALDLPVQKDLTGQRLIRKIARQDLMRTALTANEWECLHRYCTRDVEVLRTLDRRLPAMPEEWRPIFALDFAMNEAGMPVDLDAVRKLLVVRDHENLRLAKEFCNLTGGEIASPRQIAKVRAKLTELGVDLENLQRETLEQWINDNPGRNDLAARLIRNRLAASHASDAKLDRMIATARETGRVRGSFVLHAAHTGRWAGQGTQLQNLPKGRLDDPEAMLTKLLARADSILAGQLDHMTDPGWPISIKEAIAGCLRALFRAPENWVFVSADLSQIEPRVLCLIAGQTDKLEKYRADEDVYLYEAGRLDSDSRDLGKLFTLSAGYGASGRVMHSRAPGFGVVLAPEEADAKTARWRENNAAIVQFWHDLFRQLQVCVELPADHDPIEFGYFRIWRSEATLFVQLPSGRCLKYHEPRLELSERGTLVLTAQLPKHAKLLSASIWHGAITENVTQAIAADILMQDMLQLHRDGVFIVGCIHDEIVALAPAEHAEAIRDHMIAVMRTPPDWAPDLPLAAEAFINQRFIKPAQAAHAALPPSSAERWMRCPGSIAAVRLAAPALESAFAAEGTQAHQIFSACLGRCVDPEELTHDPFLLPPLRLALVLTRDIIAGRRFKTEIRLDPLPGIAKVWGTADVVVFDDHDRVVAVVDLKFGAGVTIEPDALQVQLYALLAAQTYGCPLQGVDLHIVQPRRSHALGPHRVHHVSTADLDHLFAALQKAIDAIEDPAAPRVAGDWCRFCAARETCPEAQTKPRWKPSFAEQMQELSHAFTR
jgi:DNA polymerase